MARESESFEGRDHPSRRQADSDDVPVTGCPVGRRPRRAGEWSGLGPAGRRAATVTSSLGGMYTGRP
jgi:hypothetical protein